MEQSGRASHEKQLRVDEDFVTSNASFEEDLGEFDMDGRCSSGTATARLDAKSGSARVCRCSRVGRYVFPTIRPLHETDFRGRILTPFDAREFRKKLDSLELVF